MLHMLRRKCKTRLAYHGSFPTQQNYYLQFPATVALPNKSLCPIRHFGVNKAPMINGLVPYKGGHVPKMDAWHFCALRAPFFNILLFQARRLSNFEPDRILFHQPRNIATFFCHFLLQTQAVYLIIFSKTAP